MHRLDVRAVQAAADRSAASYDSVAVVQREIADRLLARLDYLKLEPATVLDLGTGTGSALPELRRRFPRASVLGIDLSAAMLGVARRRYRFWQRPTLCQASAEQLPLADHSVDLLFASLLLPWCSDPEVVFSEIGRVLKPGGALLCTTLGPDTLCELRAASRALDSEREHVHPFIDMHDVGDALLRHGVVDPVMDVETLTINYASLDALLRDIRSSGAGNVLENRARGADRRLSRAGLRARYPGAEGDGALSATVEVVYGHGWAGEPRVLPDGSGEVRIPTSQIGRSRPRR